MKQDNNIEVGTLPEPIETPNEPTPTKQKKPMPPERLEQLKNARVKALEKNMK